MLASNLNVEGSKLGKVQEVIGEIAAYLIVISIIVLFYVSFVVSGKEEYYLLFHVLAELFSIIILGSIFIIGWNTRLIAANSFFLVIGVSSLFVAIIDLLHTLAYPGMNLFTEVSPDPGVDYNLPPQFWIAARYFQAISIVVSVLCLRKKVRPRLVLGSAALACGLVLVSIFTRIFPLAHDGTALTPFKVVSEYIVIALLLIAVLLVWKERSFFKALSFRMILAFLALMIVSEFTFTLYFGAYEPANMIGHVLKIIAYACAYKAIVQSVLEKPLQSLFKKLVTADHDLERNSRELVLSNASLRHEVGERKKAESILRQFISTISHELRTPVTVLGQSIQNLTRYSGQMTRQQETAIVSAISRNMGIMTDLVDNFMTLVRIDDHQENLTIQDVDIQAAFRDVVAALEPSIVGKGIKLDVAGDDVPRYPGDAKKIRRIFREIVDNAVKFSPRGSTISITVTDNYVGEYNREGGNGILFQVSDEGMGIDTDFLPRLYERFARSERVPDIPGSGLGLAIAMEYVSMHGGKIFVASRVDKGTTFSVFLPRAKP